MNDKSALLEQLRLNRGAVEAEGPSKVIWWVLGGVALAALVFGVWFILIRVDGIPVRIVVAQEASGGSSSRGAALLDASGYVVARRQASVSSKITGKVLEVLIE